MRFIRSFASDIKLSESGSISKRVLYLFSAFALINLARSFIVQERSTRKYLKSLPSGPVVLVSSIDEATIYETSRIKKSPIILSISEKGGSMVFDYEGSGPNLIVYPYHGQVNQQFSLILDFEGYFQIVQEDYKFLRYDQETERLVGGPFIEGSEFGFLLWSDDGRTCYAGHGKGIGGTSFDLEEGLHNGNIPSLSELPEETGKEASRPRVRGAYSYHNYGY